MNKTALAVADLPLALNVWKI